jgi:nucleotide-binding universal stress UspA family protein
MAHGAASILIAYDGSELSRVAVRRAAELFAGRPAVLATV